MDATREHCDVPDLRRRYRPAGFRWLILLSVASSIVSMMAMRQIFRVTTWW